MRDLTNIRKMHNATKVLSWTLLASAAATLAYTFTTNPHETIYYLIPFATAITAGAIRICSSKWATRRYQQLIQAASERLQEE